MQEKELSIPGGSLYYTVSGDSVTVSRFQGTASRVTVPEFIEGKPVRILEKKAFLSRKCLRQVILPDHLEEIGDWAFAYCGELEQAELPGKPLRFGRSVFLDCAMLGKIRVRTPSQEDETSELLAAAVTAFDAYYLLDIPAVGTKEWLEKWDARLADLLRTSDQEGYSRQVLCGEEDYGSTDLAAYISKRRRHKVRLAFLRLLHPQGLRALLQKELEDYLRAHTKGGESQETWQVVLEEHGSHREYYDLFVRLGCLGADNLNDILGDIGEDYPEMKAFFLRCQGQESREDAFFDSLSLD